ncbi:hypothetical protein PMAYCL1PPCAC_31631 [Pristionchus mayeri]|uniref:Fucosyltransferase n=1 Tax=Pristionchus mayeri TaxID=1317129 RepID=A0AAN5DEC6_9BILA|nr:hypothetical protein PMAYCL1PPCAC_31631 [Pristionchus mayeri]
MGQSPAHHRDWSHLSITMLERMEKTVTDAIYPATRKVSTRTLLFALLLSTVMMIMLYFRHSSEPASLGYVQHQVRFKGRVPLLPEEDPQFIYGDRIDAQLAHQPAGDLHSALIYQQIEDNAEQTMWLVEECPVKCMMTNMDAHITAAEALIFTPDFIDRIPLNRPPQQLWFLQLLESPVNTPTLVEFNGNINYTISYRWDADFVSPYGRYMAFPKPKVVWDESMSRKTKNVVWFVSHCLTANHRLEYAKKLGTYIDVEIFGECGQGKRSAAEMRQMLTNDFKFYLAFENSNCGDYVTEKFFENALRNDIVPIVMGAPKQDYLKIAPTNSFIHVDDYEDAEHLAQYLKYLSSNASAYNEYFAWKKLGRLEDSKLPCRICLFLQNPTHKVYEDVDFWWHGKKECMYAAEPPAPFIQ